jgi:hypothetical protein
LPAWADGRPGLGLCQNIAASTALLFNDKWEPIFNGDAGVKSLEMLFKHAIEGVAAADWPTNRGAFLGGQIACNISWQDTGTQATRADQSKLGNDIVTLYEPRVAGGTYAPPNIAGSTSVVASTSPEPEAAFLMLAFLTTSSIMAMNEANANGVAPGTKSVLNNEKLRSVSQPAKVWAESLDYAWCAPRIPSGFQVEQEIGFLVNEVIVGTKKPKEALDEAAGKVKAIMEKNGFYGRRPHELRRHRTRPLDRQGQAAAVLIAAAKSMAGDNPGHFSEGPAQGQFSQLQPSRRCRKVSPCWERTQSKITMTANTLSFRRRSPFMRKALPYFMVGPAVIYLLGITLWPGAFALYRSFYRQIQMGLCGL